MKQLLLPAILFSCFAAHAQPAMVQDIQPGSGSSDPVFLTPFKGKLYFTADDGVHSRELWQYDGVNQPTLVYDLNPGTGQGGPLAYFEQMGVLGDTLYFCGNDGGGAGYELYKYSGSGAPSLANDISPSTFTLLGSAPHQFLGYNGRLYFAATKSSADGEELYIYDPATATATYHSVGVDFTGGEPKELTVFNNKIYFSGNGSDDFSGREMWVCDPAETLDPVETAFTIYGGPGNADPTSLQVIDGYLYFTAADFTYGRELYRYDGVSTLPTRLTDVSSGSTGGLSTYPMSFASYMGKIYFSGTNQGTGSGGNYQLYSYNPADGSTNLVQTLNINGSAEIYGLIVYNGKLYFSATTQASGGELWSFDGTTASMVADINPGMDGSSIYEPIVWNGALYFTATNGTNGYELYRLTGTSTGVQNVHLDGSAQAFPNPASTSCHIALSLNSKASLSFSLLNVAGKVVWSKSVYDYTAGVTDIDLPMASLAPGIYYYRFNNGQGRPMASGKVEKR